LTEPPGKVIIDPMKKIRVMLRLGTAVLAIGFLLMGCQPKVTVAPDQVETEFGKSRAILEELQSYNLPEKMTDRYRDLMRQAEAAKKQGNFESAISLARQAGTEAGDLLQVWKDQTAKYQALQGYNPPETMTYHYRNLMSQALAKGEQGKIDEAKDLARQAGDQAAMSLQAWKGQIAGIRANLDRGKEELETFYPVNYPLIKRYWEIEAQYQKKEFQDLGSEAEQLLKEIAQARSLSMITDRTIIVNAPQEYVKQWGDARIYQEITPDGKFKTVLTTVPNGTRVKFIRAKLFSPELTIYYVEVPSAGIQGWISEKYLSVGEIKY